MDLVRNSVQQQVDSVLQEAAQSGFHPSDHSDANVVACQSQCDEIIAYCEWFLIAGLKILQRLDHIF